MEFIKRINGLRYPIRSLSYGFLMIFLIIARPALSARPDEGGKLFDTDDVLEIELKTDMKHLLRNSKKEEYQKGELSLNGKTYMIRLRARGNYRRENCAFPPIMLNFKNTQFEDKSYDQLKKLKLVNACKMQSRYEQYILKEYLIYRTLNLLTDKSFKVRLLKINYIDSKGKLKPITRYGFVIEDEYMMAKRLNGFLIKQKGLNPKLTNNEHLALIAVFQFMIGNTDWEVPNLQNVKLLRINDIAEPAPYVIPYDFDYTGMVNAEYAIPAPVLGIKSVRQRLYWGKCLPEEIVSEAVQLFSEKKDAIYSLYENFDLFTPATKKECISYLDSFYDIIENKKRWKNIFMEQCKK